MINNTYLDYDAWEFMSDDERMEFLHEEGISDWYNVDGYGYSSGLFYSGSTCEDHFVDESDIRASIQWSNDHDEGLCDEISECIDRYFNFDFYWDRDMRFEVMCRVYDEIEPLYIDYLDAYWEKEQDVIDYEPIMEQAVIRALAEEGILRPQGVEYLRASR